jgi:NDP-sugar pyrophosphorylase family protein
MKAMIFAAGLGTRLQPLTASVPKALIRINKKPLIEIVIRRLIAQGFTEFIINLHHFADLVKQFVESKNNFDVTVRFSDETLLLLDTGGGLKKAAWFFDDGNPFLVHNVDVISTIDINYMIESHNQSNALATLAVRSRTSSRYLLFDDQNNLCGWENQKTKEKIIINPANDLHAFAFSGIQIISPDIFKYITQEGNFPIIDVYLKLAASHTIKSYEHSQSLWMDVGKVESLKLAGEMLDKIEQ